MTLYPSRRMLLTLAACSCLMIGRAGLAGEWNVGFQRLDLLDPQIDREIEVALWYPTAAEVAEEQVGPATLMLAVGAAPVAESRGVIVFSHGFAGSFLSHNDTARYLAENGYLVATPTHPDEQGLATGQPRLDPLVLRPHHVRFVLDELLEGGLLATTVPEHAVGIVGFSLGAYTALVVSGATPDASALEDYCAAVTDDLLCSTRMEQRVGGIEDLLAAQPDPRIGAAVLLAPAYGPLFGPEGLDGVDIPLRLYSAERDEALDNTHHADHLTRLLGGRAEHHVVAGAGHYAFMTPCPPVVAVQVPALCEDPDGVDRSVIHRRLNSDILEFFDDAFGSRR